MVNPTSSMQSEGERRVGDLEAQLACKEREWKELQSMRIHELQRSLRKAEEECLSLRKHQQQLKEAFHFNLALLDERDRELHRYDVVTDRALTVEQNRQEELRQLRAQVALLEERRSRDAEERQEELSISQNNAAQYRLQLDQLRCSLTSEIQRQAEEYERMKWDLHHRIQQLEGQLTLQRQELTAVCDSELRRQQHEFNLKMDEMRAVLLSDHLKMKLLSKETEVQSQTQVKTKEALKTSEELCQQLQTQLQQKDLQIKDLTAVKDRRIKELEAKVELVETKLKKEEGDHIKKYEDMARALKEGAEKLEAERQAHTEHLQRAEEHRDLLSAQIRSIQKDQQEALEQKDETIQRLRTEVNITRTGWDNYINQASSEMVTKDTEMITLRDRESKLRTELERSREDIERYKQQLGAGLKREKAAEQRRVQVELEWQKHCEELKSAHYLANEQLIQDLTQARDQAKAELNEKERELQDLTVLLRSVRTERDQVIQGLTPKVDYLASEEISRLQEQNSILRAVVTQMRKDMEGLCHVLPHPQAEPQASSPQPAQHPRAPASTSITPTADTQMATEPSAAQCTDISSKSYPADYTQALEQERSLLKARCRHLEGQLEAANTTEKPTEKTYPQNQGLKQGSLHLEKEQLRGACLESDPTNIMEQKIRVPQLLEAKLHLWQQQQQQQQALGLMPDGSFGNIQDRRSNPPLLHTRLKQAASYIARLSREKQQLIEMGNCLRAQITTAGLHEPVEPERGPPKEKQGDQQHNRLSALEQLQYQLTTQELQFALRQRSRGPTDRPESSKNKENTSPLNQEQSSQPRSPLLSDQSLQPLQELWDILDQGLSSSVYSEGERGSKEPAGPGGAAGQMTVCGFRVPTAEAQQRTNPSNTPLTMTKTSRPTAPSRISKISKVSKIRNYNVKD